MLKIGVVGAGHLGKIHLKLIKESKAYQLIGFYDHQPEQARLVSQELGIKAFDSFDELLEQVEVVDVVTPTLSHHYYATQALRKFKHVFIEKPVSTTLQEAREINKLSLEAGMKVQIGHVERFNPAFVAALPFAGQPMFIETHRLAQFNPRGTDVSVVLDLMIHDIDIVLHVVKSNIKKISASGVAVVSQTPDICNARIEFENGCVANLTASRLSMKNMRKTRLFQRDAYISIDFLDKEVQVIRMQEWKEGGNPMAITIDPPDGGPTKEIIIEKAEVKSTNAIKEELESFARTIQQDLNPVVTIQDGIKALEVAFKIIEKLSVNTTLQQI